MKGRGTNSIDNYTILKEKKRLEEKKELLKVSPTFENLTNDFIIKGEEETRKYLYPIEKNWLKRWFANTPFGSEKYWAAKLALNKLREKNYK